MGQENDSKVVEGGNQGLGPGVVQLDTRDYGVDDRQSGIYPGGRGEGEGAGVNANESRVPVPKFAGDDLENCRKTGSLGIL